METVYLAKIPVFNKEGRVYGFEINYQFEENTNTDFNRLIRSLYKVLSDIDITRKVEGKPVFIHLSQDVIIFTDFTSLLPHDLFIIKVPVSTGRSRSFLDKVKELRMNQYRFCLSEITPDFQNTDTIKVFQELVDYIEIDINKFDPSGLKTLWEIFPEEKVMYIAEGLDSFEDMKRAKEMNFSLFKGEFFTKPEKLETSVENFSKLETLRLMRIVHDEDDLNTISEYIKGSPSISVSLLKYINSSFFYLASPINSVNRAVAYLGKKNLLNWLILLSMISVSHSDIKREAVKRALFRGKFMELITKKINSDENIAEMAFVVGVISLSEGVFNLPLETIVSELNFNQQIAQDIKHKKGFFGKILMLSEMVERNRGSEIKEMSADLTLEPREVMEASVEAMKWSEEMFSSLYR